MLSDSTQIGICVAVAAVLQTASGGIGFVGGFKDDSELQRKFIRKDKKLNEATAVDRVSCHRKRQRVLLGLVWLASIVFSILAIAVIIWS